MAFEITFAASDRVQKALAEIGRTEDVKFSPDNRRLAIAGYTKNQILIINTLIEESATGKRVTLSDCTTITSPSLQQPHGLFFIDDQTLIVANRSGEVPILRLPRIGTGARSCELSPLHTIPADQAHYVKTPGSIAVSRIGLELYEILLCNNYVHYVTRHIVDGREGFRARKNEVLLSKGLDIPDGIAVNEEWGWIAVSNHKAHSVLMFRNGPGLNRASEPDGILRNAIYPHGIRFTADDRFILVADAGAPYLHIYAKNEVDWKGERTPVASIRIMDEKTFLRGRYSPEEGGPKGVDITNNMSMFVTTCHNQTLAFFDLETILQEHRRDRNIPPSNYSDRTHMEHVDHPGNPSMRVPDSDLPDLFRDARLSREVLLRELLQSTNIDARMVLQKADLDAAHARQIQLIYQTRSWRITAPLRRVWVLVQALKQKIVHLCGRIVG